MTAELTADRKIAIPLEELIGSYRTFGPMGPAYEVLGLANSAASDIRFAIRVIETGEELEYPIAAILDDPIAP
ncbi:MAG: DUF5397 domain-containing protein [Alphaproteobacteria bacterium]|nr:DUF5397 domain-containing protein [Alphaproteobacteria bacterium]